MNNIVSRFCIVASLTVILCNNSFSQKKMTLFFGDGFNQDTCTVILDNGNNRDTVLYNKVITTKESLSFAEQIQIEYSKSNKTTSILIIINNTIP